jgi:RNA polymerase sigma-70 factor (ECF subfamily)
MGEMVEAAAPVDSLSSPSGPGGGADERALFRELAAGNRDAGDRLVESTYRMVYASVFRLCGGDEQLAADLTQETYRKAWASLPRFDGRSRFSTWLYRIAYNTFLKHVRRPRRMEPLDEARLERLADGEVGAEDLVVRGEMDHRLRRAVLGLSDELRFTVSARFWGELSVSEIAALESVTGAAIRKRLKKAFQILRTDLEQEAS